MNRTIFIYNNLLDSEKRDSLRFPMTFISYAYIHGKMYNYYENKRSADVFTINKDDVVRKWGNDIVYGALFAIEHFEYYIRIIDSMYICSKSRLFTNHKNDLMHRYDVLATPIKFDSLDDLARLKYTEKDPIECTAYFGNPKHDFIRKRVQKQRYRVHHGIDIKSFKASYNQLWEVVNDS